MAFGDAEIVRYTDLIEKLIWAKRRPPLHLRGKVREGQRISGSEIELFMSRPSYSNPPTQVEESVAKVKYVRKRQTWQLFWKRADMKWRRYQTCSEVKSLEECLRLVDEDTNGCFWG
jgi:hypothetical protein